MSRKNSVVWPEKRFCEDETYWKCALFAHLDVRELGRVVKNEVSPPPSPTSSSSSPPLLLIYPEHVNISSDYTWGWYIHAWG